MAHIWY